MSRAVRQVKGGRHPKGDRFRIIDEQKLDDSHGYAFSESADLTEAEATEALIRAGESHLNANRAIRAARNAWTAGATLLPGRVDRRATRRGDA